MDSKGLSIGQVVERTGLPASTIRYYDQQVGEYLGIQRGKGRRRDFSEESVELLQQVNRWLREEGLSLRQVRSRLAHEEGGGMFAESAGCVREVERISAELAELQAEVQELKDIQQRTLNILSKLAG